MNEQKKSDFKLKKKKWNAFSVVFFAILVVYAASVVLLLSWGVMNTFKHVDEFSKNPAGLPHLDYFSKSPYRDSQGNFSINSIFANYVIVLDGLEFRKNVVFYTMFSKEQVVHGVSYSGPITLVIFLFNTVVVCFAGTILPAYTSCIVGYTCSKYRYRFSEFVYALVIFIISLPVVGRAPAMVNLLRTIGFYDNLIGYMIWNCNFASMYFMVFYAYYRGMSGAYVEAAEIDGASQFKILTTIALPMAGSMIAASAVVLFVQTWNDYSTPLTYLPTYPTMAYGIYHITRDTSGGSMSKDSPPIKIASLMFLSVPAMTFFVVFRKQMMANLSIGGIKE